MNEHAKTYEELERELTLAYENLSATHTRCSELLLENRDLKSKLRQLRDRWADLLEACNE